MVRPWIEPGSPSEESSDRKIFYVTSVITLLPF